MIKYDDKIQQSIKNWSYPVWFIIKNEDIDCPCVNYTTHQADPNCKKCFGTGKKTMLRQVNAAHQNNRISIRGEGLGMGEIDVVGVYYTLEDAKATEADMVLDGDTLDVIQHFYPMRSDHSAPIYYKYETAPKKTDMKMIIKNIKDVLRGAGYSV